MKNEIIIDTTKANNKTLKKLEMWVKNNPIHRVKKRIILKNCGVIYCTNYS